MSCLTLLCALGAQADKDRDGPEDKAFQTPLQAVLLSSKMEARFRMFLSRTKASNRCAITHFRKVVYHVWLLAKKGEAGVIRDEEGRG